MTAVRAVDDDIRVISDPEGTPGVAPRSSLRHRLVALDGLALLAGWTLAFLISGQRAHLPLLLAVATGAGIALTLSQAVYRTHINAMRLVVNMRLLRAAAGSAIVAGLVARELEAGLSGRQLLLGGTVAAILLIVGRYWFEYWLARCRAQGRYIRNVVIVGHGPEALRILRYLRSSPELGLRPVAVVGDIAGENGIESFAGGNAIAAVRARGASGAILVANGLGADELNEAIRELAAAQVHVHLWNGVAGIGYRRLVTTPVGHEPFLYIEPLSLSQAQLFVKRALDIVVSSLVLLLAAPVLALAAAAIKLQDRGPVLFRQTRVGRDGRAITVHKLRTMVVDAESRLAEVQHLNARGGPLFKASRDPRVTSVGRFLRGTSIDELPQLFDVLMGRMSLVGPRPALPKEVAEFGDRLLGRLRVRPGVTGLWQVEARDNPSFELYERLDLFYVENWSLLLDLAVLVNTVPAVVDRAARTIVRRGRSHLPAPLAARPPVGAAEALPPITNN